MNSYELILIFDPNLGEEKIKATLSKIENKIKSLKAEIEKIEDWGIKKLASTFLKAKKLKQGYYTLIRLKGASSLPHELTNYLKVTENVIRYSIARAVEQPLEEISGVPLVNLEIQQPSNPEIQQPSDIET